MSDKLVVQETRTEAAISVGGMRWPAGVRTLGGNATAPFVRLCVDAEGVHLAPNGRMTRLLTAMFLMPSYDFPWTDVGRVNCLKRGGIRFTVSSLHAPVIFWSADPTPVLDAIASYNIPMERQPQPVYGPIRLRFGPLSRPKLVAIGSALVAVVVANVLWTMARLPADVTAALRLLVLIVFAVYVLVTVFVPDDYWTRGR